MGASKSKEADKSIAEQVRPKLTGFPGQPSMSMIQKEEPTAFGPRDKQQLQQRHMLHNQLLESPNNEYPMNQVQNKAQTDQILNEYEMQPRKVFYPTPGPRGYSRSEMLQNQMQLQQPRRMNSYQGDRAHPQFRSQAFRRTRCQSAQRNSENYSNNGNQNMNYYQNSFKAFRPMMAAGYQPAPTRPDNYKQQQQQQTMARNCNRGKDCKYYQGSADSQSQAGAWRQ